MQSQQILKMSSSSPNAGTQASAPLVDGIVNHVRLQSGPDLKLNRSLINSFTSFTFYRAMHFSAKRGIAIACRLSVCLSVRL